MSQEVVVSGQTQQAVPVHSPSEGLLAVIANVSRDPSVNVDKLERLLDMQMQVIKFQREAEFNEALAACQAEMPQLDQNGRIDYNKPGSKPIPYALLEDIDAAIRPIYSRYGFAVAWDTAQSPTGEIEVIGDFKHRCGHSEKRRVFLAKDSSGGKTAIQGSVSTISYGKKTLLKMFFNLVEKGTDKDGAETAALTQDQAETINSLLSEVGADRNAFLKYMGYASISEILAKDYQKAVTALQSKRRAR